MECVVIGEAVMAKSKGTNVIIVLNKVGKYNNQPPNWDRLPLKQSTCFTGLYVMSACWHWPT